MCLKKRYQRSLPYINGLLKTRNNQHRVEMLRKSPPFVLQDVFEVLYNAMHNNCKLTSQQKHVMFRKKKPLIETINKALIAKKQGKKQIKIYKQSGGFLGALLPIVASVIAGTLANG